MLISIPLDLLYNLDSSPEFRSPFKSGPKVLLARTIALPLLWFVHRILTAATLVEINKVLSSSLRERDQEKTRRLAKKAIAQYRKYEPVIQILEEISAEKYGDLPLMIRWLYKDVYRFHDQLSCDIETFADILAPDDALFAELDSRVEWYENKRSEPSLSTHPAT